MQKACNSPSPQPVPSRPSSNPSFPLHPSRLPSLCFLSKLPVLPSPRQGKGSVQSRWCMIKDSSLFPAWDSQLSLNIANLFTMLLRLSFLHSSPFISFLPLYLLLCPLLFSFYFPLFPFHWFPSRQQAWWKNLYLHEFSTVLILGEVEIAYKQG